MKSTVEEIRERFDADVERFSNLQTGQSATIDAPLVLDLITQAAAATTPDARCVLDVGCGAGNYALKLLEVLPDVAVDLVDLSQPVLDHAAERVRALAQRQVTTMQDDIRELELESRRYGVIVSAATLHHLRRDEEWEHVFAKLYDALRPGGSFWISDLVTHSIKAVHTLMWERYGDYLSELRDEDYREHVFAYIEKEDTPRSLIYQLQLLRTVGFHEVEVLHKNGPFVAFGGVK